MLVTTSVHSNVPDIVFVIGMNMIRFCKQSTSHRAKINISSFITTSSICNWIRLNLSRTAGNCSRTAKPLT